MREGEKGREERERDREKEGGERESARSLTRAYKLYANENLI